MHCHNKCQIQECFGKRITRIISSININTKKYHPTASLASASSSKTLYETYKRNIDNQDKLPCGLFESAKQIQIFKHNFKVAMHGRSNLCQILKVNTTKGIRDILTSFILIEEDNLKGACIKCTPNKKGVALNMFIAL
eukprot:2123149-Ditylum_brightwellii.AAC.1